MVIQCKSLDENYTKSLLLSTFVCLLNYYRMKKNLLLAISCGLGILTQAQNCSDIFISEYVEGTNNNKAIELYNPTPNPIVLDGQYSMGRDRDGAGVPMLLGLTGTIAPYDVRVFVLDKRDPNGVGNEIPVALELQAFADTFLNPVYVQANSPMYFNGDDAFVLVKGGTTILDIVGKIGEDPSPGVSAAGWWQPGDPNTRWWTTDNTLIRKSTILQGVTANPDVFDPSLEWDSIPADTYDSLGFHRCACGVVGVRELEYPTFSMFPNPIVDGQFAIRASADLESVRIVSASGQLVFSNRFFHATQFVNMTLPEAAPGLYFVEVDFADGRRITHKVFYR